MTPPTFEGDVTFIDLFMQLVSNIVCGMQKLCSSTLLM